MKMFSYMMRFPPHKHSYSFIKLPSFHMLSKSGASKIGLRFEDVLLLRDHKELELERDKLRKEVDRFLSSLPNRGVACDPETEVLKSSLGAVFRCGVCGRLHNPEKRKWRECLGRVLSLFCSITSMCKHDVPEVLVALKGQEAFKALAAKYLRAREPNFSNLDLVVNPAGTLRAVLRCMDLYEAESQVLREALEKLPDKKKVTLLEYADSNVEDERTEIVKVGIGEMVFDGRQLCRVLFRVGRLPPTVVRKAKGDYRSGRACCATILSRIETVLCQISRDVKYAVVRRDFIKCEKILSSKFFLVDRSGRYVQISNSEAEEPIALLVKRYFEPSTSREEQ